jgi:hypothetical protein
MDPNIEVLGYCLFSSQRMEDFIAFCVAGTPGDPTEPGVFEWLYSRTINVAHFFTSAANDSLGVFGATVLQPPFEPTAVPWTDQIRGFQRFVSMDGELARIHAFPALRATVTPNQYLDDEYQNRLTGVARVFEILRADSSVFTFDAQEFKAALRGDPRIDRRGILSEIENRFGAPLFEKPDREKILESLGSRR